MITIFVNVNSKEYYKHYRNKDQKKTCQALRRGTLRITFEAFASQILSPQKHKDTKKKSEKLVQNQSQISKGKMTMKAVSKSLFVKLNNTRVYLGNGIISISNFDFDSKRTSIT